MPVQVRVGSRTFRIDTDAGAVRVDELADGSSAVQEPEDLQSGSRESWGRDGANPSPRMAAPARLAPLGGDTYLVVVGGRPRVATAERDARGRLVRVTLGSTPVGVAVRTPAEVLMERLGLDAGEDAAAREVRAPMPGLVLRVLAAPGDAVEAGQGLVVLEAMKMENELKAPAAGTVAAVHADPGAAVAKNDLLVELA